MSEFYSVYLFMWISGILLCIALWKRFWVFFMFSGLAAIYCGLYFTFFTAVTSTFIQFLGIFCILGGLVIFFSLFAVLPKTKDEIPMTENYRESLRTRINKTSELYRRTHRRRWDEE